jgi:hypothetical protein
MVVLIVCTYLEPLVNDRPLSASGPPHIKAASVLTQITLANANSLYWVKTAREEPRLGSTTVSSPKLQRPRRRAYSNTRAFLHIANSLCVIPNILSPFHRSVVRSTLVSKLTRTSRCV